MKHLSLLLLITLFFCTCSSNNKGLNTSLLRKRCAADKGIIMSCFQCSCIPGALEEYLKKGNDVGSVVIYSDSVCFTKTAFLRTEFLRQSAIDSIYEKNYNLMLYKKHNSSVSFKLISTEESDNLTKIANSFFE